jgi:predicted nucleotidyltransferase component of viral defense system
VIEDKYVDLYARNSGLRDKVVAERDIVLTYALRALLDAGVMEHLAFKGGTCLRKLFFGSTGRFSEDLDFTLDSDEPDDDVLTDLVEVFNAEHHGITFTLDEYYKTTDETSFGGEVLYRHAWNDAGRFQLQVSLRERPTLPTVAGALKPQAYFGYLEFEPFEVRALDAVEMVAEKVRATFQRIKVRDLYDLYRFATTPFNGELLRRLVVLKLWQARDPFDPEALFQKLRGGDYDWTDLRRLVRPPSALRRPAPADRARAPGHRRRQERMERTPGPAAARRDQRAGRRPGPPLRVDRRLASGGHPFVAERALPGARMRAIVAARTAPDDKDGGDSSGRVALRAGPDRGR